ncbi:TetR/AcrR family transcriptional regulator [Flavonifractor hominis]|uniref:TetR/AcrR family transcriptional regulator n=1 Tax=Flavonifractor hominis TaxID=3133178 RepID=A0ABV1EMC7_9FIRM
MPSTTFYNLPPEKRERLLAAARAEFVRVPYEEASVNRIIQAAGIPRGSFYMYFTDKEDLFRHLMECYARLLEERMAQLLDRNGGDLFAAFLELFDHIRGVWRQGEYREIGQILCRNRQMQPWLFLDRAGPEAVLNRLRDRVDLSRLDLQTETDLSDLFHLLVTTLAGTLVTAQTVREEEARARLVRVLGILQRGAASKAPSCEEA